MKLKPGMIKHTEITRRPDGTIVKKEIYKMEVQGNDNENDSNYMNVMNQFENDIKNSNNTLSNYSIKEKNSIVSKPKHHIIPSSKNNNTSLDFIQESLKVHNEYRIKHSAPPLVINEELNQIAQQYAEKIAASGNFAHSGTKFHGDHLGENLYMCNGMKLTGKNMTQAWYDEIKMYDFKKATFSAGTGHFTQVVWVNSKEVGFGVAQSKDGSYYGVANYYPAGNLMGKFAENVRKA